MFNAFNTLGLDVHFDLDSQILEQAYLKAMYVHHPDQRKHKSASQVQQAAQVNEAYKILKNPVQRALHFFQLFEISLSPTSLQTNEILMESMAMREELEEASTHEALTSLLAKTKSQEDSLLLDLGKAFKKKNFEEATFLTERLRYIEKFSFEVQQKVWTLEESSLTLDNKHAFSAA